MLILAYHDLDDPAFPNEKRGTEAYHYVLDLAVFTAHMQALYDSGRPVFTAPDLLAYAAQGKPIPNEAVGLTFDDGHASFFELARPVLKRFGFLADVFQVTDFIGQSHYHGPDQLVRLKDEGFAIGSHGASHQPLTGLGRAELSDELSRSRNKLSDLLGDCISFAYPHGAMNRLTQRALKAAGYQAVYTSEPGLVGNFPNFAVLKRVALTRATDMESFRRLLADDPVLLRRLRLRRLALESAKRVMGAQLYRGLREHLVHTR